MLVKKLLIATGLVAELLAKSHPLVDGTFDKEIRSGTWFIKYYTQWCKFSRKLKPFWIEASDEFESREKEGFFFGEVDCDVGVKTCDRFNVTGYPTLLLFNDGVFEKEYTGGQEKGDLINFASSKIPLNYSPKPVLIGPKPADKVKTKPADISKTLATQSEKDLYNQIQTLQPTLPRSQGTILDLTAENFNSTIHINYTGPWMVEFFSPRCPHCQAFMPDYMKLANRVKGYINLAKVDCDAESKFCGEMGVNGVPDLRMYNKGQLVEPYKGTRLLDVLMKYLKRYYQPQLQQVNTRTYEEKKKVSLLHTPFKPHFVLFTENIIYHYGKIQKIRDYLTGFSSNTDFFLIEDNYASLPDSYKSNGISLYVVQGKKETPYTRSISFEKDVDYDLKDWVFINQQPLASQLSLEKIKEIDFSQYQMVLGYYANDLRPVSDDHLRVMLQDTNLAYQSGLKTSTATNETLPLIFCYLPEPITKDQSQNILKELNIPVTKLSGTTNSANPEFILVDSSIKKYRTLSASESLQLTSIQTSNFLVQSLHEAQTHISEGEPLLVTEQPYHNYLPAILGALAIFALVYYAYKRNQRKDDIEYSKLN